MPTRTPLVAFIACAGAAATAWAQVPYRTVALSGQQAPGAGEPFSLVSGPRINNRGDVAFDGRVAGGDDSPAGVWLGGTGGTRLVALEGQPAPDGSQFTVARLALLADNGHVGVGGFGNVFWVGPPGGLQALAQAGANAPGTAAPFRDVGDSAVINASGEVAFIGRLLWGDGAGSGTDTGIWAGTPGSLRLVARQGNNTPLQLNHVGYPAINDSGQVAFMGASFGSPGHWGIYFGRGPDDLVRVIDRDDAAPGVPGFNVGAAIGDIRLSNTGALGFTTSMETTAGQTAGQGVWRLDEGGLALVARSGTAAPGLPGRTFTDLEYGPHMNEAGRVLFRGYLDGPAENGPANSGLWAGTPDNVSLVAAEGQLAPGAGGARFGDANVTGPHGTKYQAAFINVQQNEAGQVAWLGSLVGETVDESNDTALFATDTAGKIVLVAREGNLIDVGGGELRRIDRLFGYQSYLPDWPGGQWFNDAGELAFSAQFPDGSTGVFVASVPEPAAASLVIGACAIFLRRRRD